MCLSDAVVGLERGKLVTRCLDRLGCNVEVTTTTGATGNQKKRSRAYYREVISNGGAMMQDLRIGVLCRQRELGGTSHCSDARAELRRTPLDFFGSLFFFFSPFGSKTRQLAKFLAPVLYIVGIGGSFEFWYILLCIHLSHSYFFNSCFLHQNREKLLRTPTEHRPCLHRPTPSRRKETNRRSRPQTKRASRYAVSANKNRRNINAPGATCHSTFRASPTPKGPRRCLFRSRGMRDECANTLDQLAAAPWLAAKSIARTTRRTPSRSPASRRKPPLLRPRKHPQPPPQQTPTTEAILFALSIRRPTSYRCYSQSTPTCQRSSPTSTPPRSRPRKKRRKTAASQPHC